MILNLFGLCDKPYTTLRLMFSLLCLDVRKTSYRLEQYCITKRKFWRIFAFSIFVMIVLTTTACFITEKEKRDHEAKMGVHFDRTGLNNSVVNKAFGQHSQFGYTLNTKDKQMISTICKLQKQQTIANFNTEDI